MHPSFYKFFAVGGLGLRNFVSVMGMDVVNSSGMNIYRHS